MHDLFRWRVLHNEPLHDALLLPSRHGCLAIWRIRRLQFRSSLIVIPIDSRLVLTTCVECALLFSLSKLTNPLTIPDSPSAFALCHPSQPSGSLCRASTRKSSPNPKQKSSTYSCHSKQQNIQALKMQQEEGHRRIGNKV